MPESSVGSDARATARGRPGARAPGATRCGGQAAARGLGSAGV